MLRATWFRWVCGPWAAGPRRKAPRPRPLGPGPKEPWALNAQEFDLIYIYIYTPVYKKPVWSLIRAEHQSILERLSRNDPSGVPQIKNVMICVSS